LNRWEWLKQSRPRGLFGEAINTPQGINSYSSSSQRYFPQALLMVFIPNAAGTDIKFIFIIKGLLFCSPKKDTSSS
jgi:hypothetical protein